MGHTEFIIEITVEPSSCRLMVMCSLIDSFLAGNIIHPTVLSHINYEVKQGGESKWKMVAGVMRTSECLKIEKAMLLSITVSQ